MFGTYVAGISYAGDVLRTAVLRLKRDGPVLCHLSEERPENLSGAWFLKPVVEPAVRMLRKVSAVSVGVDNASVFYHSFPADPSLSREEREEMIDWELSQYISEYAPPDFVRDVHMLAPETGTAAPGVLVVAANRAFVQNVTSLLHRGKLDLQVIETNFFGAVYALGANYPEASIKRVLVASIEGERVDAGILSHGKLERYACRQSAGHEDLLGFLAITASNGRVDQAYLAGGGATHALIVAAKPRLDVPVELLNPVRKLRLKRSFAKENEFAGVEHRFASVIGCALRRQ